MHSFSSSFLEILRGEHPLENIVLKKECKNYKNHIYKLDKTVENAIKIAPIILQEIKKEQKIIKYDYDYYVALDVPTNTFYICFKNILMIDIDSDAIFKEDVCVINHFEKLDESYCIYKSTNGYHVFCVSKYFNYYEKETLQYLLDNHCDYYYAIYCYLRGFCVRLNKKNINQNDQLYKLLHITKKENANESILKKINLDNLLQKYKNTFIFNKNNDNFLKK